MKFRFNDGRDWFFEKKIGLFMHWGIYAIDAWHEQLQYLKKMPGKDYALLVHQFNPQDFDPDNFIDIAESLGAEYITFTTKHIDGFCMFDSEYTDYNITKTPYGKDILKMLSDACHRRNMPLCLYYSVYDMNHPNYPYYGGSYELSEPEEGDEPNTEKYIQYVKNQVTELCSNYGKIHGFWWDGGDGLKVKDPSVNDIIRSLQPDAIINNRGLDEGDFDTPERDWYDYVQTDLKFNKAVEACQSIGFQSWGYRKDEDYYTSRYLMKSIDRVLSKGGNYLLNVGPKADGTIDIDEAKLLERLGNWYRRVRESYDRTETVTHWTTNRDVILTRRGNILYVHMNKVPDTCCAFLEPIGIMPEEATLLNDGRKLDARVEITPRTHMHHQPFLRIRNLPTEEYANEVMVIKLIFNELPQENT